MILIFFLRIAKQIAKLFWSPSPTVPIVDEIRGFVTIDQAHAALSPGMALNTDSVLSVLQALGICTELFDEGSKVFEFPHLTQMSNVYYLPTESGTSKLEDRMISITADSISPFHFSKLRRMLLKEKDRRSQFKCFMNSFILRGNSTFELWFHQDFKLHVLIRGPTPQDNVKAIHSFASKMEKQLGFNIVCSSFPPQQSFTMHQSSTSNPIEAGFRFVKPPTLHSSDCILVCCSFFFHAGSDILAFSDSRMNVCIVYFIVGLLILLNIH